MNTFNWVTGRFSSQGKPLSLYRRGRARAKMGDHQGAIDDYTVTIDMPDAPANVKAMALFNRALVYAADGDDAEATDDLNMVLAMAKTPPDVKTEARRKLERMKRQLSLGTIL